jgi:CheY-like chemotaxis protein
MNWAHLFLFWTARIAWPILVAVLLWRLFPAIRRVVESRAFTIKVAGMEISVQQATDQLAGRVDDLQAQLVAIEARIAERATQVRSAYHFRAVQDRGLDLTEAAAEELVEPPAPEEIRATLIRRILWTDDTPENNVFDVSALIKRGYEIRQVTSTNAALEALATSSFDAVITDMGRIENGHFNPDAGLDLIRELRRRDDDLPVIVYTSPQTATERRDEIRRAGATVTASSTQLTLRLQSMSSFRFARQVARIAEQASGSRPRRLSPYDFQVTMGERRMLVLTRTWSGQRPRPLRLERIRSRVDFDQLDKVILVTPTPIQIDPAEPGGADVENIPVDALAGYLRRLGEGH